MKNKVLFTIVAIIALSLLASCSQKSEALTVATDAAFPPFEIVDEEPRKSLVLILI